MEIVPWSVHSLYLFVNLLYIKMTFFMNNALINRYLRVYYSVIAKKCKKLLKNVRLNEKLII